MAGQQIVVLDVLYELLHGVLRSYSDFFLAFAKREFIVNDFKHLPPLNFSRVVFRCIVYRAVALGIVTQLRSVRNLR